MELIYSEIMNFLSDVLYNIVLMGHALLRSRAAAPSRSTRPGNGSAAETPGTAGLTLIRAPEETADVGVRLHELFQTCITKPCSQLALF